MASSPGYFALLVGILVLLLGDSPCWGFGTIGFDFHHSYSDQVKGMLAVDELPEKGTPHYYAAMAHRDHVNWKTKLHGRGLLDDDQTTLTPLTFGDGNETYRLNSLGYLHYANVSVGTPSVSFLVALDTGSDLFWLPCDCKSCVRGLQTSSGQKIDFNIYSPNASSTSESISCSNSLCPSQGQCPSPQIDCKYKVEYLDNGTSSTGVLVEDVLHLAPDVTKSKPLEAKITFGCGQVETGSFLDGAAPNGLFGLGMSNVSVPSTLAREGYTSNSFSMCFGEDGLGRISFGDTGSSNQGETPFNLRKLHPTYNISIDQIVVGGNTEDIELSAIFDTGTSFTYLNDPAYSVITKNFDSLVKDPRHSSSSTKLPFEYCYEISSNQTDVPTLDLMMKGGQPFNVTDPLVFVNLQNGGLLYCLGLVKSGNVNIIGQNFMTGYKVVFDRERNVLGWTTSDCYANRNSNSLPIGPTSSYAIPPVTAVNPEATDAGRSNTSVSSGYHSTLQLTSFSFGVVIALVVFLLV